MNQTKKAVSVLSGLLTLSIILAAGCHSLQVDSNADQPKVILAPPAKPTVYVEKIRIVVTGRVVDVQNRPVSGVSVMASLGMDLEGKAVKTDDTGRFTAEAGSDSWSKTGPLLRVWADGFASRVVYFNLWDTGTREFNETIVLHRRLEDGKMQNQFR